MTDASLESSVSPKAKAPKSVAYILSNEAAERFSFYGMRCILAIFMAKYLLDANGAVSPMSEAETKEVFHWYVAVAYLTPLLGSLLSDIFLGKYKTVVLFSALDCVGLTVLAMFPTREGLYVGLGLVALGSGVVKPCVTANVGDQFTQSDERLLSRIYSWFYFAINFGAFASNLITPILLEGPNAMMTRGLSRVFGPESAEAFSSVCGPRLAFGTCAVAMGIATFIYFVGGRHFRHVPPAGTRFVREALGDRGWLDLIRVALLFVFLAPFWAIFDQMDSAWPLQIEKMDRVVGGYELQSSTVVSLNPLLIMLMIPLFTYAIYPFMSRFFPLSALRKISIGLFVAALPFCISAWLEHRIGLGETPTVLWMLLPYVLLTAAEIMVSITALEFAYSQARPSVKSFVQALFFLSITLGNVFAALVNHLALGAAGGGLLNGVNYFLFFSGIMVVAAILFVPTAYFYPTKSYLQAEAPAKTDGQS